MLLMITCCCALVSPTPPACVAPRAAALRLAQRPDKLDEQERRALRLPTSRPTGSTADELRGADDPLDSEAAQRFVDEARARVKRRWAEPASSERSKAVVLLGRVAASAALGLAFAYSYFVRSEADGGAAWALAALGDSGSWLFGLVGILFGQAPGGVLALLLALLNLATAAQSASELLSEGKTSAGADSGSDGVDDAEGGA